VSVDHRALAERGRHPQRDDPGDEPFLPLIALIAVRSTTT
jgi:hypothetical protein